MIYDNLMKLNYHARTPRSEDEQPDMPNQEEIIARLAKPGIYNYRDLLESITAALLAQSETDARLFNTVELFAFGRFQDYFEQSDRFIELSAALTVKLAELTVLSICNANVGNKVMISYISAQLPPDHLVEDVVISMVERRAIRAKIDEAEGWVRVVDTPVLRDAFNEQAYALRVLQADAVASVSQARRVLEQWLEKMGPEICPTADA